MNASSRPARHRGAIDIDGACGRARGCLPQLILLLKGRGSAGWVAAAQAEGAVFEASSALQAAGYVLGRVASIIDITCNYIGEVKTQSPAAGTIAPPGTAVSVGIGKPGGKCLS